MLDDGSRLAEQSQKKFLGLQGGYAYIRSMYPSQSDTELASDSQSTQEYFDAVVNDGKPFTIILTDLLQEFNLITKDEFKPYGQVLVDSFMLAVDWLKQNIKLLLNLKKELEKRGAILEIVTLSQIMYPDLREVLIHDLFAEPDETNVHRCIEEWAEKTSKRLCLSADNSHVLLLDESFKTLEEKIERYANAEQLSVLNKKSRRNADEKRDLTRMSGLQKAMADYTKSPRNKQEILPDYVHREMVLDWWLGLRENFIGTLYSQGNKGIIGPLQFVRKVLLSNKLPHYILVDGEFAQMFNNSSIQKPPQSAPVNIQAVAVSGDKKMAEPEEVVTKELSPELSPTGSADSSRSSPSKGVRLSRSLDDLKGGEVVTVVGDQRRTKSSPPPCREEIKTNDTSSLGKWSQAGRGMFAGSDLAKMVAAGTRAAFHNTKDTNFTLAVAQEIIRQEQSSQTESADPVLVVTSQPPRKSGPGHLG